MKKEISALKDSIFSGSHLSIWQILGLMFYFVMCETCFLSLKRKTKTKQDHTIVDWPSFCDKFVFTFIIIQNISVD
jgi:hypothetical protein